MRERMCTHIQFAATSRWTATPPPGAILNSMNLSATLYSAAQTPRPSKPGPIGSWEELALRQLRILRMVELLAKGYSYRGIAREMGIARTTVMRMAPEVARLSTLSDDFVSMLAPAS